MRGPSTTTKNGPCSLQLEEALKQQWRPSAAKNGMWMSALGFGVKDQLVFGPNDVNCSIIYTDASVLAWRIPQSMGSQRVRHDLATNTHVYTDEELQII